MRIESKQWDNLQKAGVFGKNLSQSKVITKTCGCLTFIVYGVIEKHKTFRGFTNVSERLDGEEHLKMLNSDKNLARAPSSRKNGFNSGVIIPDNRDFVTFVKKIHCVKNVTRL